MRKVLGVLLVAAGLGLVVPLRAQQQAGSFFTGADPRQIRLKPIDVSRANKAYNLNRSIKPQRQQSALNLSNMFRGFTMPSWPPKVATPTILKGPNPIQPNPFFGKKSQGGKK